MSLAQTEHAQVIRFAHLRAAGEKALKLFPNLDMERLKGLIACGDEDSLIQVRYLMQCEPKVNGKDCATIGWRESVRELRAAGLDYARDLDNAARLSGSQFVAEQNMKRDGLVWNVQTIYNRKDMPRLAAVNTPEG